MKKRTNYVITRDWENFELRPSKPVPMTLEERYFLLMMIDYPTREEQEEIQKVRRMLEEKEGK